MACIPKPERRDSINSATSTSSPLVFGTQRRYSRAYDQPIVSSEGSVVENNLNKRHESTASLDGHGKVLNPRAFMLTNFVAKICFGVLFGGAILISLIGRTTVVAASQLFGFIFMFLTTFLVSSGLYFWWGVSNRVTVPLSVATVLYVAGFSSLSGILSHILASFTVLPIANKLPMEATYFVYLAPLLFVLFSLLAHRDSFNGMFSEETCIFVGLTLAFDLTSMCLFRDILPSLLCGQLVSSSMLFGTTLSLISCKVPALSLNSVYWALSQGFRHRPTLLASHQEYNRPVSRVSMESSMSSVNQRTSVSSMLGSYLNHSSEYESDLIGEAHGLITDLLLAKDSINSNIEAKLKKIRQLISPRVDSRATSSTRLFVGNNIGSDRHDYEVDLVTRSRSGSALSSGQTSSINLNRHSVSGSRTPLKLRSMSTAIRQSVSRFSTTTTASGMPILENEPADRERSLALREVRARISVQEKRHSVHKMGHDRLGSLDRLPRHSPVPLTASSSLTHSTLELAFKPQSPLTSDPTSDSGDVTKKESVGSVSMTGSSSSSTDTHTTRQPVASPPESPKLPRSLFAKKTSEDLETAGIGAISEEDNYEGRQRSRTLPSSIGRDYSQVEKHVEKTNQTDSGETTISKAWTGSGGRPESGYCVFSKFKQPSVVYQLSEYTDSCFNVFEQVASWDFPIFELEELAGDHILSQMAYVLFQEAGLIDTFQIPQREFINFFRVLEANYGSNVYHNKTHAADVLHGVSYLLFEMIPGFSHQFTEGHNREWKGRGRNVRGGNIASAFSILEVFACYIAAAMHDFDHPGRTNAFLVGTKSPLAILYNDRSVLENHHAAASWDLLTCVPANNFLTSLDEAEIKRFRFLIVEAILATDLKLHFDILSTFKAKTHPEEGEGINWMSEVDRLMVMKILIKMADINTPTKSYSLHRAWTERITEEFYQQSEEETKLGLPATIFMDRNHPEKLPAIQLSFIQHLVSPLFNASATAGIIPGVLEFAAPTDAPTDSQRDGSELPDESLDLGDDAFTFEKAAPLQKFMSILLTNLDVNFEAWKAELPSEDNSEVGDGESEKGTAVDEISDTEDPQTPINAPAESVIPEVTVTEVA